MGRRLFTAALTLACTACVLHVNRELAPPPGFKYEPQPAVMPFESFDRKPVELSEPFDETRTHEIVHISFPSSGHNGHPENRVEGQYFRSKESGRNRVTMWPAGGEEESEQKSETVPLKLVHDGETARAKGGKS